jgi:hypothetical protein
VAGTEAQGMNTGIREEARAVWRRKLATGELYRLLGPMNIVPHARTEEEGSSFVRALHSMLSEGSWDGDALLDQAGRYLEVVFESAHSLGSLFC